MMAPRFANSRVVWSFSGVNGVTNAGGESSFTCYAPDMVPSILSLDASWGFRTAYNFTLSNDMPRRQQGSTYYYAFDLPDLRNKIESQHSDAKQQSIIFRAEYACNCPGTYIQNVTKC